MEDAQPASAAGCCRGSEWRRWDPHLHAPGTLLADRFPRLLDGKPAWDGYLEKIESSDTPVSVLGVTDYFCIRTYQRACEQKASGRLKNVDLLFPNVELRLDLKTERVRPINLHLLFSPEDPNHIVEIERVLSRLSCHLNDRPWHCTEAALIQVGRLIDPRLKDADAALAAGANQFKVNIGQIKDLFREDEWVRKNCLVAVAGSNHDGTAGLKNDDSYALTRREIERFAHIIFSATPGQRDFWLGKKPGHERAVIEGTYGSLKPCLHGSDAHHEEKVVAPDLERYCWIKGDPTFDALRQAVLEPDERVWIGATPPGHSVPQVAINVVRTADAPWLGTPEIELNHGLVAVIGARGSGKTALVEIIAKGAYARGTGEGESSFLSRASKPRDLLGNASVELSWRDLSTTRESLITTPTAFEPWESERVCYLSQQFVDRLCSSAGLARELRAEMERVIFEATDPLDRLDTSSFDDLMGVLLEPLRRRRDELREEIRSRTQAIVTEEELKAKLPQLAKEQAEFLNKIEQAKKDLASLLPKGKEEHARKLAVLEQANARVQTRVETLMRRLKALGDLGAEVDQIRSTAESRRHAEMRRRYPAAELSEEMWKSFAMVFAGDVDEVLAASKAATTKEVSAATVGDPAAPVDLATAPPEGWPLNVLRERREAAKSEVGIDAARQMRYDELRKAIEQMDSSVRRISGEIEIAKGAEERRRAHVDARRGAYAAMFDAFAEAEATYARLYEPLSRELMGASGALGRLEFFVHRRVDLSAWVAAAEDNLLDLRLEGRLRGHGALRKAAETWLLPSLLRGSAKDVAAAMDAFRKEFFADLNAAMPRRIQPAEKVAWVQSMAEWLYSTAHIRVEYGIRYDGTAIEQLSPGTRGIVLLLLYLAIDKQDRRPIIVDQPEENLDPKSVFDELVPHFREARRRRQVIIVTHNANLVVNTDADQVIVASSVATTADALPTISYDAGGLENPRIRKAVCETLEGGERAFLERERRYRLRWIDMLAVEASRNFADTLK